MKSTGFNCRWPLLLSALLLAQASFGLMAQTLVYEREFSLIGEADNTLRISLTPDDRLVIERPVFMTRAGRHEAEAAAGSHQRLSGLLSTLSQHSRWLNQDLQVRARQELVHVSDPEHTRFYALDDRRGRQNTVSVDSPQAWARHFDDDIRLAQAVELEREWYSLMAEALEGIAQ